MKTNMDKQQMRKLMQDKRNLLTKEETAVLSEQICTQLAESTLYRECKNICVYRAFRNEVSCEGIMTRALAEGKQVYVPVTDRENGKIEFYQVTDRTVWKIGAYQIKEPVLDEDALTLQEKALVLMPGLVFDRKRHRLGYGGGYYDRYLEDHPEHVTAALCYRFQVLEDELPCEKHDILPDYIFTETDIFQ